MQDQGFSVDAVTAAIAGDKEAFLNAFNNAIANKVSDALEVKKVEIASNLLGQEEVTNEVEGIQTEVDGSEDANGSNATSTEEASQEA
jgi:hypothetical protein